MRLFNSLSRKVEEVVPREVGKIGSIGVWST